MNSFVKGETLENKMKVKFVNVNLEFRRPRQAPGDGSIDYFGGHREFTILTQIKNYIQPGSIGPKYIREMEW
ncbi:12419_t:CDS:1, partial [Gigaspora rosea]